MKTSGLFKGERLRRNEKYKIFKKKLSLFNSNKKQKLNLFPSKKRKSVRVPSQQSMKMSKKKSKKSNKENYFFPFKKKRKSVNYLTQSGCTSNQKRKSLINISRAYSKYKHSLLESETTSKVKKKNVSMKKYSFRFTNKRKKSKLKTLSKRRKTREKSESNQGRSKFIEINKGRTN
jgi:GH24 family phage-related lysozyme (muramidase)